MHKMAWKFYSMTPLFDKGSMIIDIRGELAQEAKRRLNFVEDETGLISSVTDLKLKKQKRNRKILQFKQTYQRLAEIKKVSIILVAVSIEKYTTAKQYMDILKDQLKSNGLELYGYYYQRDIGEKVFKRHFHFMVATSRIANDNVGNLLKKCSSKNNKATLSINIEGFSKYLMNKEIYCPYKHKSWGCSRYFNKPNTH